VKLNKAAKNRIKRLNASERKAALKAAILLADLEIITPARYAAIHRTLRQQSLC
tara:strand:+ start:2263 stop:2424 length:162 start_codon:yes stop_codon:yes gene_type:complete